MLIFSKEFILEALAEWQTPNNIQISSSLLDKGNDENLKKFREMKKSLEEVLRLQQDRLDTLLREGDLSNEDSDVVIEQIQLLYDRHARDVMEWARYYNLWDGFAEFPNELLNPFSISLVTKSLEDQPHQVSFN